MSIQEVGTPSRVDRRTGCAAAWPAEREPLFATAPAKATRWLLVEHPGPWPASGPPPGLPEEVLRLYEDAGRAGIRWQWIRPVRDRRGSSTTVIAVALGPDGAWVERRMARDLRELADLDVAALADGRPPGFGIVDDQLVVLVCTHGRRDVCCARLGRPVAGQLAHALPGMVWETTHVGGHRYATNVVTLPDGHYHGGVTLQDVNRLVDALMARRVVPDRLRGRAGFPAAVQAADYYARLRYGVYQMDDVIPLRDDCAGDDGTICVELRLPGGTCVVRVRPRGITGTRLTSCAEPAKAGVVDTFDLVAIEWHTRPGG